MNIKKTTNNMHIFQLFHQIKDNVTIPVHLHGKGGQLYLIQEDKPPIGTKIQPEDIVWY